MPWRGHHFNTEDIDSNVNFIYIDALGQKIPHRITANDYHLSPKTISIDGLLFASVRDYLLITPKLDTGRGSSQPVCLPGQMAWHLAARNLVRHFS